MSDYTDVLSNTQTLISFRSITPNDAKSHAWLMEALERFEYNCSELNHDDVTNFLAIPKNGLNESTILFVGHTDVVPANETEWQYPPFEPTWADDILYGRGAVDMKSSIAAMLSVIAKNYHNHIYSNVAFLITSNEEGENNFGIEYVLKHHSHLLKNVKRVLIGEPTSENSVGDTIKVGRRGSLNLLINIKGQAGHVAYPQRCHNPIDKGLAIMRQLNEFKWGKAYPNFNSSKMTIVNVCSNSNVFNATPSECEIKINWRFNPSITIDIIQNKLFEILNTFKTNDIKISTQWFNQTTPFYNTSLKFANEVKNAISNDQNENVCFSTSGGTSDARFFDTRQFEVVELGPRNYSAHKTNEHISKTDLLQLKQLYENIVKSHAISCSNLDHQV